MKDKKAILVIVLLIVIIAVLWKYVYRNGYAKKNESGFLSIDGTWYMVPQWQDSWPLN